ncbi:uncharacterized protein BX663DRAFT_8998 [Cokeromyces recurvatus]|uniref:uncharacterized protein n=1 Tax=Cokeromyces recurvatus TaxID=90255 RepID=UPI00221E4FE9|nr:uncharacterized protein BX663DRAFT_8998 [Cokeromyces recurvatus]KAI7907713.1 hypothetical protein BX663DRAFT_8998 [Cokeromyces recurvatus]
MYDPLGDATITHYLNACSIPCIEYNNELSLVLAPHASRRIYHYRWNEYKSNDEDQEHLLSLSTNNTHHHLHSTAQLPSAMSHRQRLSKTLSSFLGLKIPSSTHHLFAHHSFNPSSQQPRSSTSTGTHLSKNTSKDFIRQCSIRRRRHSSYNDYGYACQLKTDQYIKQYYDNMANQNLLLPPLPNLSERPRLIHSIRTTPLESTAKEIVNIAIHGDRVATVNRRGDIALYALNGTTAARVTAHLGLSEQQEWMEDENDINSNREDDELSDGYDFVRSRLAMGPMGLIYGSKNGTLWWLDFGYRV